MGYPRRADQTELRGPIAGYGPLLQLRRKMGGERQRRPDSEDMDQRSRVCKHVMRGHMTGFARWPSILIRGSWQAPGRMARFLSGMSPPAIAWRQSKVRCPGFSPSGFARVGVALQMRDTHGVHSSRPNDGTPIGGFWSPGRAKRGHFLSMTLGQLQRGRNGKALGFSKGECTATFASVARSGAALL